MTILVGAAWSRYYTRSATLYTADGSGFIAVTNLPDVEDLITAGCYLAASVGAAGGGFIIDPWTTGLTHTVTLTASQTITIATSATVGAKTPNIPAAAVGNSGYLWIFKATLADGTSYTITPASGTIDGASTYVFSDNAKDAVWMISNGVSNWGVV